MWRKKSLVENGILDLLEDGLYISDIKCIDNDDEIFPDGEFDQLSECFDNDVFWLEDPMILKFTETIYYDTTEKKIYKMGTDYHLKI